MHPRARRTGKHGRIADRRNFILAAFLFAVASLPAQHGPVAASDIGLTKCGITGAEPADDMLALSGGGYRAMLFHVGALWRFNELGCLATLKIVSSVSGGSIVAGVLAANWSKLDFDEHGVARQYAKHVAEPVMRLAGKSIDGWSIAWDKAKGLEAAYETYLFGNIRLSGLPDRPEFLFNATNLQTGEPWVFSKRYMGDAVAGRVLAPNVRLAAAVAASSAFPPVLSPYSLDLSNLDWQSPGATVPDIASFRDHALLSDGGIIDNLGLESLWGKPGVVFVSDAGAAVSRNPKPSMTVHNQTLRVVDLIHGQHDVLRTRILIEKFKVNTPDGVYWTIRKMEEHCEVRVPGVHESAIKELSGIETRLARLDEPTMKRLVNWGYLSADRAMPYLGRFWKAQNEDRKNEEWKISLSRYPFPDASIKLRDHRRPDHCDRRRTTTPP